MTQVDPTPAGEVVTCGKCGAAAELRLSNDGEVSWVACTGCGMEGPLGYSDALAVQHWNEGKHRLTASTPPVPEVAAEERDALLAALGWKTGPFKDALSRKVILEDSAGLRPEMVKARDAAADAQSDRDLYRMLLGEFVHDSRSGVLGRVWEELKQERKRRRAAERLARHPVSDVAAIPVGMKLVPVEPTHEMIRAGSSAIEDTDQENVDEHDTRFWGQPWRPCTEAAWSAMLAAAPDVATGSGDALREALRRAATDLMLTPRHNRDGAADRHIEESRDRIRSALSATHPSGDVS